MTVPTVMVLGRGRSAMEAAKEVAAQSGKAILIRTGNDTEIPRSLPNIEIIDHAGPVTLDGGPGCFTARLDVDGKETTIEAGAIILACEHARSESEMGMSIREALAGLPEDIASVAVVLGPHAPRSSYLLALELGQELRSREPAPEVTVLVKEMMVRGIEELTLAATQKAGVRIVRYNELPSITDGSPLVVTAMDQPSGIEVTLAPEALVLEGLSPHRSPESGTIWSKAAAGNVSMGPTSSIIEGIFLCRPEERGLWGEELQTEARTAATRALTVVRTSVDRLATSARVDRDKCSGCLTCVRSCPFSAPYIDEEGRAVVLVERCQSCGICVAACPSRAILLPSDEKWKPLVPEASP